MTNITQILSQINRASWPLTTYREPDLCGSRLIGCANSRLKSLVDEAFKKMAKTSSK